MWWADTSNDALKIRNAADDGFVTVGTLSATNFGLATLASPTFTGNVGIPAGSASAPAVRRSDDTNTGLYFSASDTVNVSTGGTNRVQIDTNGITVQDRKTVRFRDTSNSNFVALRAPDDASSDITLTLPSSDGNANDVLQSDGSGNLSFAALPQAVPTGSVHLMATTTAPSGYLKCNGAAVSRTTEAALFAIIGTTWGAGDGSTTFNLPDLRGEFVRGWADNGSVDSGRSFGSSQSDANKQHNHTATSTSTISPADHNHVFPGDDNLIFANGQGGWTDRRTGTFNYDAKSQSGNGRIYRTSDATISASTSTSIANDGGSEARPRNVAMMYVIKT
ncbi:phage tail protein [Limnobacter sp.]|uniref:phage tail protein n=1 Tax=Limnobacter sp. TaxID=2003368 RepID=UPI0025C30B75|nr:phage tail protein [Limnobacter sp.]